MPNLIIISGPQAVGKMTVAEEIQKRINYILMTNHDSIELAIKIFGPSKSKWYDFNETIRAAAFQQAIKNNSDMIFTYLTVFGSQHDLEYIKSLQNLFETNGGDFYFVELYADVQTRLERNITPHRLATKPSKKNLDFSKKDLLESMERYRMNSNDGEKICQNHLKIDNTNLAPDIVADMVIKHFGLGKK